MAYMAVLGVNVGPDGRGGGFSPNLDWGTSLRGVGSISIVTGSPWSTVQTSPNSFMCDYFPETAEDPTGQTYSFEVRATPRADCAGWTLDRWCVERETANGVYRAEEVRPHGDTLVAPLTVLGPSWYLQSHLHIYPYFVYNGTGRLLATPAGGALVGYSPWGGQPSLVIDL